MGVATNHHAGCALRLEMAGNVGVLQGVFALAAVTSLINTTSARKPKSQPQLHQPQAHQSQLHQPQLHRLQLHQPPRHQPPRHQPQLHQPPRHQPPRHQPQLHQPPKGPPPPPGNPDGITCPVMRALVKMKDLVPGLDLLVSRQQTFDALLRVGISAQIATEVTDTNFKTDKATAERNAKALGISGPADGCQKCPAKINLFKMNTIPNGCSCEYNADGTVLAGSCDKCQSPDGEAQEHFRSTGICDNGCGNDTREFENGPRPIDIFGFAESQCLCNAVFCRRVRASPRHGDFITVLNWTVVRNKCFAELWDKEPLKENLERPGNCFGPDPSTCATFPQTMDLNQEKRPTVNGTECTPVDNPWKDGVPQVRKPSPDEGLLAIAEAKCPSQMHGSLHFIFQSFGTPRESPLAEITQAEYRSLWLDGEYTTGFKNRSPRTCIKDDTGAPSHGCQECLDSVPAGAVDSSSFLAERYCLCILANVRDPNVSQTITKFKSTCPSFVSEKLVSGSFTTGAEVTPSSSIVLPSPLPKPTTAGEARMRHSALEYESY